MNIEKTLDQARVLVKQQNISLNDALLALLIARLSESSRKGVNRYG